MMTATIGQLASEYHGEVGKVIDFRLVWFVSEKDNCIALHRPINVTESLNAMMNTSMMSMAFGSGTKKIMQNVARTFYFKCDNTNERNEWVEAIEHNLQNYFGSEECFNDTVRQFCEFLKSFCGIVNPESWDWKCVLTELYSE